MEIARFLHVISVVVWVGGMFFAYVCLRPAAATLLEPPQRLPLWRDTLGRFFFWVWVAVVLVLGSGWWMVSLLGGFGAVAPYVHGMFGIGIVMMLIFAHVYFAPYRRLSRYVVAGDWKAAGAALGQIRKLVAVNLTLGLINVAVGILGRLG